MMCLNMTRLLVTPGPRLKLCVQHFRCFSTEDFEKTHIPTTDLQKFVLGVGSALTALSDPWRADMVAVNGEVTGLSALKAMHERMSSDAEGRQILDATPRITNSTLASLSELPPSSLGGQYYAFMAREGISPSTREEVRFVGEPCLAYVMTRYRETHDLTHCLLGMPTNMVGEVVVKWVEALQYNLPMCVTGAIFGPLRFGEKQRAQYKLLLPWALKTGENSKFLLNCYYEQRWDQDMDSFKAEFNILNPPNVFTKS